MTPMILGAIIVSVANSLAFFAALAVGYLSKDQANLSLLIGAVIANSTTVVAYWLGSSSGSARKTDLLAGQGGAVVAPQPPVPGVTP